MAGQDFGRRSAARSERPRARPRGCLGVAAGRARGSVLAIGLGLSSLGLGLGGCEAATYGDGQAGLGFEDGSDGAEADGHEGEGDTQADTGGEPPGDGDDTGSDAGETGDDDALLPECSEPTLDPAVHVELGSKDPLPDPCADLSFSAEVAVASVGTYGLIACDCDAPLCNGEKFELTLTLPNPLWMPALEPGDCHRFRVFSEEVAPGVCRHNRVDIASGVEDPPWYSTGSAREDLDHGGLAVTPIPIPDSACRGECGAWTMREVEFTVPDAEPLVLGWAESGFVGPYEVTHWRSFVGPEDCDGASSPEITAWTAR